jgi:GTP-dependent phosphoenolpyruvate carboxykinase
MFRRRPSNFWRRELYIDCTNKEIDHSEKESLREEKDVFCGVSQTEIMSFTSNMLAITVDIRDSNFMRRETERLFNSLMRWKVAFFSFMVIRSNKGLKKVLDGRSAISAIEICESRISLKLVRRQLSNMWEKESKFSFLSCLVNRGEFSDRREDILSKEVPTVLETLLIKGEITSVILN